MPEFLVMGFRLYDGVDMRLDPWLDWMELGALPILLVGWYEYDDGIEWDRVGGHYITLVGARSFSGGEKGIYFNDPARAEKPDDLHAQSPFITHYRKLQGIAAEFNRE